MDRLLGDAYRNFTIQAMTASATTAAKTMPARLRPEGHFVASRGAGRPVSQSPG